MKSLAQTQPTKKIARAKRALAFCAWIVALLLLMCAGGSHVLALTATPSTTEGPYYTLSTANNVTTPGNSVYDGHFFTAEGADNDLTHIYSSSTQSGGSVYLLSGTLVNTSGTAIPGAVIELWEADNGGIYWYNSSSSGTNNYTSRDQKFQGYGRAVTDSSGAWSFRAIKPGLYTGRIRHFHFKVNVNGTVLLTSQFMFSEDSASFSSDNVAQPLVQAGTMSLVTLTTTSGTDSTGASVLIGSKQIVVSYSGTITGAPTITTQPTSVTPATGSSATFSVTATATGTLSYQWYKGKSVGAGGATTISGATGASYTISSVTSASVGAYYCVVTSTSGSTVASVNSNAAALTIGTTTGTAPTITTQPASQSVATGSNATFSVVASNATIYQWYKGTVGSGTAISGATAASYTVSSVTSSSAGTYYVVVSNSSGSTTSSGATLTVTTSAPTITTQPSSQSVAVGGTATFSVVANGAGTLSYQWYKGTAAISGATGASYTVSSVTTASAGSYSVGVTNAGGTTTSNMATLTITGSAPMITSQPANTNVLVGDSTSFTVAASSDSGTLSYQWYKGAVGSSNAVSGATTATYRIAVAALSDAGSYYAVVSNASGSVTSTAATLTVTEPYTSFLTKYGLNATTGATDADPDGDGISNGLEFLLGGSPISADTSILPTSVYQLVNGTPAVVFSFNLVVPVGGTTWTVEYSSDLLTWSTATQGTNGVTMTMGGTATTTVAGRTVYPVTVTIPTTATQTYTRLRVTPAQ